MNVKEMDLADIKLSVVPGRKNLGVDSEGRFPLTSRYPGRFMIFPYIDPTDGDKALYEIDMKKVLSIGLSICMAAALFGCSAGAGKDTAPQTPNSVRSIRKSLPRF